MIKGVAFDLEGTIINVEELHFEAFILTAAEFGLNLTFETLVKKIPYALGGGDKRISRGIAELIGVSDEKIFTLKREHYSRLLEGLEKIEPRPGFIEVFNQIRSLGLNVAIGSLTAIEHARILLERSRVGNLFPQENEIFEKDVKNLKPAPDVYCETARRMNIKPSEQLVIEDSATGLVAASLAGSERIAVPIYSFEENLIEIIKTGTKRIFLDWREMNVKSLIENLNK